ncbi:hypothetical protein N0V90_007075 [Kalmusia sp. IMI 367209]|nr:hypothetical protein N0V90_007075 [Kalmusia sp. IMI 367209]
MRDTSFDTPYLHGTDQEVDEASQVNNHDAVFSIYLEHQKVDCGEAFDLATEPPVRLLGLDRHTNNVDPLTKELPSPSIKNYHLRCLKADEVKFIPVSHPWHPSVAEAYALRTFNPKAAQTCYEAPIRTLLAVIRRFGPDYFLWHDYISIPQWQDDFRGTVILPQIFKIFEASGSAIMHLGHQPPVEIARSPNFETISEYSDDLKRFFTAHLFTRLWPIVEADRAGEAFIMNNEYEIMEQKFSTFVKQILNTVSAGATTTSNNRMSSLRWIYDLPLFVQEQQKNKCLGYVYDMIADLGCRSFRDKFIGAAELLGISDYPTKLPADTQEACLWLAERQLQNNDFSPLLLRPSAEPKYEKNDWLKGHNTIQKNMWGWGIQTQPANDSPRVKEHSVELNLNLVGMITHDFSWDVQTDNRLSDELSNLITSTAGSTTEFLRLLKNIDPASIFRSISSSNTNRIPGLDFNISSSKTVIKILSNLLERQAASNSTEEPGETTATYDKVVSLLALSASVPTPNLDHFEGLGFHQSHRHIYDPNERSLVSISCSHCHKQSIFRVEIWKKPMAEARLYLIPGLTYQYTAASGTGIIMEEDRIIGRARFCASACNCNHAVPVKIS